MYASVVRASVTWRLSHRVSTKRTSSESTSVDVDSSSKTLIPLWAGVVQRLPSASKKLQRHVKAMPDWSRKGSSSPSW